MNFLHALRQPVRTILTALITLATFFSANLGWADTLYFVHTDHLGTPRVITDNSQQSVWEGTQQPFGEVTTTTNAIEFNVRLPGQYYDLESGLHYNYFRDYDPSFGRYVQSDPIGLRGGLNTYGYAYQNPIMYTDPTGQLVPVIIGGIIITGEMIVGLGTIGVGVTGMLCVKGMICDLPNNQFNEEADEDSGQSCPPENENTNPYEGPVSEPVVVVNGNGIAIPVGEGERIGSSPDGSWQELKDKEGNRTGTRVDAGHPKTHDDPRAQGPHGHRDGVTNSDGTPWLPW